MNESNYVQRKNFGLKHLLVFSFLVFLFSYFGFSSKTQSETSEDYRIIGQHSAFPRPYSDEYITENARITDPRFKDSFEYNNTDNLSNVISAFSKNNASSSEYKMENGTWLWTDTLNITPEYRDNIISELKQNKISNIYLSIDTYLDIYIMPDGEEKNLKLEKFNSILRDFIKEADKNGITVDAEAGWRNWAEEGNEYKAFAILEYVKSFNQTNTEKFRGVQYDIEPYLLENFQENSKSILTNFVSLSDKIVTSLNNSDLSVSFAIPEFYDGKNGWIPKIYYKGKVGYAFDHLINILDRRENSKVILMSYRNFSQGDDSSVDISRDEIQIANKYKTKVIVAQEIGDVEPRYLTFYKTSRPYYEKQIQEIKNTFSREKSFGGIAVHYINALAELK